MTTSGAVGVLTPNGVHEWEAVYIHSDGLTQLIANTCWVNYKRSYQGRLRAMVDRIMQERKGGWYSNFVGSDFTMPTVWNMYPRCYQMVNPMSGKPLDAIDAGRIPYMLGGITKKASANILNFMYENMPYCPIGLAQLIVSECALVGYTACIESETYHPTHEQDHRFDVHSDNTEWLPNIVFDVDAGVMMYLSYIGDDEISTTFNMDSDIPPFPGD